MLESPFEITTTPCAAGETPFPPEPASRVPLQQHPRYIAALQEFGADAALVKVRKDGRPMLSCFLLERQFLGAFTLTMGFRGPTFVAGISDTDKVAALRFLKRHYSPWKRQFLQLMPELIDSKDNRNQMKQAGFTRIMTGTSTIWIDLSANEASLRSQLAGNWRNQLKKTEQGTFTIAIGGAKPKHYNWLLEKESEQRQNRGYSAIPLGLVPAYQKVEIKTEIETPPLVSVTAHEKGAQIAGALFLLHGTSATYYIGWVGKRGRALNAQNRVLFDGMLALRKHGIKWLDLGGVDTGPQAAIARFKLGLGHPPETFIGTYLG